MKLPLTLLLLLLPAVCWGQGVTPPPYNPAQVAITGGLLTGVNEIMSGPPGQIPPGGIGSAAGIWSNTPGIVLGNFTVDNANPYGWATSHTGLYVVQNYPLGTIQACPNGGVSFNGPVDFANYPSFDDVATCFQNYGPPPKISPTGTFTTTTFVPSTPVSSQNLAKLHVNEEIETNDATPLRGLLTSWDSNGTSFTVSGWYAPGNTASGQVPTGSVAYFGAVDRVWALNTTTTIDNSSLAKQMTGIEIDMDNNSSITSPAQLSMMGLQIGAGAHNPISEGIVLQGPMMDGYVSRSGSNAYFLAMPDTLTGTYNAGFLTYQTYGPAFQAFDGVGGFKFTADSVTGSLDMGPYGLSTSPAETVAIRLHTQGGASAIAGATITAGGGTPGVLNSAPLVYQAANHAFQIGGNEVFEVYDQTGGTATTWLGVSGGNNSAAPAIITNGSDSAINLVLAPKGGTSALIVASSPIQLPQAPTAPLQATTKGYVDSAISGLSTTYAPLASPVFTGTPTLPTMQSASSGTAAFAALASNFKFNIARNAQLEVYDQTGGTATTWLGVSGGNNSAAPAIITNGSDSAINLVLAPKGGTSALIVASSPIQTPVVAVSALPSCSPGFEGARMGVNNALSPVALAAVVEGGTVRVPVYCNGTNWIVG